MRTVVLLELSPAAYEEIKKKVVDSGQADRIMSDGAIDMFEIAVCLTRKTKKCEHCGGYGYSSHIITVPLTCKYCKGSGRIPCDENGKEIK
jgi:hypothetical protein